MPRSNTPTEIKSPKQGRGRPRNGRGSREAILEAAILEFSERGFDGARMSNIAKRAGFNGALVYRHFKDKQGVFEAALRSKLEERSQWLDEMPEDLADAVKYWFRFALKDPVYVRLLQRESLRDQGGTVTQEEERKAYYRGFIQALQRQQKDGKVNSKIEPKFLTLAMISVTLFPLAFPQIARLVTGQTVDSTSFRSGWDEAVNQLISGISME